VTHLLLTSPVGGAPGTGTPATGVGMASSGGRCPPPRALSTTASTGVESAALRSASYAIPGRGGKIRRRHARGRWARSTRAPRLPRGSDGRPRTVTRWPDPRKGLSTSAGSVARTAHVAASAVSGAHAGRNDHEVRSSGHCGSEGASGRTPHRPGGVCPRCARTGTLARTSTPVAPAGSRFPHLSLESGPDPSCALHRSVRPVSRGSTTPGGTAVKRTYQPNNAAEARSTASARACDPRRSRDRQEPSPSWPGQAVGLSP
jgi:hypothetical protein